MAPRDVRRLIPSVDRVLQDEAAAPLVARYGRAVVLRALRGLFDEARRGKGLSADVLQVLRERLAAEAAPSLVGVVNATGVVVHTNLGRAPLSREAAARVAALAASNTNLEYDLETGERGEREVHTEARLRALLRAEATAVVNNCAAAVLLAVNTFAEGRDVLVSRGELVEIGGSFRIPEILGKAGARLREVGTTNKTRVADYRSALSPATGMILRVHRSNFDVVGFTEQATREELAGLAREAGIPVVEDLGSGLLAAPQASLAAEPTVAGALAAGVDVVAFSGDKLLGGPQAGILAGRAALVTALRRNPLYRALRVDKMTLAALDVVLADHDGGRAAERIPVLRMLALGAAELLARATALATALRSVPALTVETAAGDSAVGGGAAPTLALPTTLVAVSHARLGPDALAAGLRRGATPVIVRILEGRVVLDPRTIAPEEEADVLAAFRALEGDPA
jgi:L-seryl-tRNA(Ser) seleniumtransferase